MTSRISARAAGRPPRAFKPHAPAGMRMCADCGLVKSLDEFTPTNGIKYRKKICKPCRAAVAKATYLPRPKQLRLKQQPPTERTCTECGVLKPITDYTRILWNKKSTGFTQPVPSGRCAPAWR